MGWRPSARECRALRLHARPIAPGALGDRAAARAGFPSKRRMEPTRAALPVAGAYSSSISSERFSERASFAIALAMASTAARPSFPARCTAPDKNARPCSRRTSRFARRGRAGNHVRARRRARSRTMRARCRRGRLPDWTDKPGFPARGGGGDLRRAFCRRAPGGRVSSRRDSSASGEAEFVGSVARSTSKRHGRACICELTRHLEGDESAKAVADEAVGAVLVKYAESLDIRARHFLDGCVAGGGIGEAARGDRVARLVRAKLATRGA